MADSDFERVCAAAWAVWEPRVDWKMLFDPDKASFRRGMAAALREMREPSEAQIIEGGWHVPPTASLTDCRLYAKECWQAMIDALLAQAEDREAAQ